MALDEALLAAVERGTFPPVLRLYGWDPPAVSLGRHQPDPDPKALARLEALGVDWVRRPTGGRAVYHGTPDKELTYSVIARLAEPPLAGGLALAYLRIHEALAAGLARLGARTTLAARVYRPRIRPVSRLACFAASVPGEIMSDGRKLVGSAQRRDRKALLQHGSIPLAGDQRALEEAWPGALEPGTSTTVSSAAGRRVCFVEAASAIAAGVAETLGVELTPGECGATDLATWNVDALTVSNY
jgi:lipoate-protein ligase A